MSDERDDARYLGPSRGAVGGSGNEAGSAYRAGLAAWLATMGLAGRAIEGLDLSGAHSVPVVITLEVDDPVDDIRVTMTGGVGLIQAKRELTLGSGDFRDAVEQVVKNSRSRTLERHLDRLIIATESRSGPVLALRAALQRRRRTDPGSPTVAEQEALGKLKLVLEQFGVSDSVDIDQILDVMVILQIETTEPNAPHRALAEAVLAEAVVAHGEGPQAFTDLMAGARSAAIGRYGRVLREWLDVLEVARRTVRMAVDGSPSAGAMVVRQRLAEYRAEVALRGLQVDLRGLGIALSPVSLTGPTSAWEVVVSDRGKGTKRDLRHAVKRLGRAIVLGPPGAGKSSALRQLAASMAADAGEPVPVVVPLQHFLTGPLPADVKDLVRVAWLVRPDDKDLVDELAWRLVNGEAALFLDGLDETRNRRFELISAIDQIVVAIDPGSDIVLSTRDVAYAEAVTLGWATLLLAEPEGFYTTLGAIGESLASSIGVSAEHLPHVVDEWLRRYRQVEKDHPVLRSTPLLAVLTYVLVAQRSDHAIPKTRARILWEVIEEQMRRKEVIARKAVDQWPRNTSEELVGLLGDSLAFVGHELFDRASIGREKLVGLLGKHIEVRWMMGAGAAAAAADAVLHLWDEAAVFVASGYPPEVSARLRGIVEVAEARYATGLTGEGLIDWVAQAASDPASTETLLIAAGSSSAIANELVDLGCTGGNEGVLLIAAEAVGRGAEADDRRVRELTKALTDLVRTNPTLRNSKALARFPVVKTDQDQVQSAIEAIPNERVRDTAAAIAALRWSRPVAQCEHVLRRALRNGPPKGGRVVDEGWEEAVTGGVDVLLGARVPCDDDIIAAYRHASASVETVLDAIIERHDRHDLVLRTEAERYEVARQTSVRGLERTLERLIEARDRSWRVTLEALAGRPRSALTRDQARRMADLGDLWESVVPWDVPASWVTAAEDDPEAFMMLFDYAMSLGDFDMAVIAAEAALALELPPTEASFFLHDSARPRELRHWAGGRESATFEQSFNLVSKGPLFAHVVAAALRHAPDPAATVVRLDASMETLDLESRMTVAELRLALDGSIAEKWLSCADPVLRRTAARHLGASWCRAEAAESLVRQGLLSADGGVRFELLDSIADGGGGVSAALVGEMDAHPPAHWQCLWCGRLNAMSDRSCVGCRTVGIDDIGGGSGIRDKVVRD